MPWSARAERARAPFFRFILRLYDPTAGTVRIDGRDLRNLRSNSLSNQIGLVTQETFLFHDTIFNNIQFGRLDATEEEIYAAARSRLMHTTSSWRSRKDTKPSSATKAVSFPADNSNVSRSRGRC